MSATYFSFQAYFWIRDYHTIFNTYYNSRKSYHIWFLFSYLPKPLTNPDCLLSLIDPFQFYQSTIIVVATQSLSHVWLFAIPWTAACQASLSFISRSLLKLMSIESVMPSNHLILCCPFSSCPQSFPASGSFPMSQLLTSGHFACNTEK